MVATDRYGHELHVGNRVVVDGDIYEIISIEKTGDDQYLLHLLEIGRLLSLILERRMDILSNHVELFEWFDLE